MPYIEGSIAGHKRYHTSKDPKYRTLFCPKSLDQNKNQVHPIFCEGVSLHRRWNCLWRHKVIYQFFHPCSQFLIIVHGGSFLFGGDKNLKITALSFISTGPDRCACKEPLAPSTWTKCSSRHLPRLSTMWKVKQDPFFCRLLRTSSSLFCRPSLGIWIPLEWWSRFFQSLHSSLGKAVKSDTFATKRFLPHQNSVKHKTELSVFVQRWS